MSLDVLLSPVGDDEYCKSYVKEQVDELLLDVDRRDEAVWDIVDALLDRVEYLEGRLARAEGLLAKAAGLAYKADI